jgi:hypothetical protein
MKLKFVYVLAFLISGLVLAGPKSHVTHQPICDDASVAVPAVKPLLAAVNRLGAGNCPDVSKLRGICNDVYGKIEDKTNTEEWNYAYERKIYEAACVNFAMDSLDVAKEKIRNLWSKYQSSFKCDGADFDIVNGNILKYAVTTQTTGFIENAAKIWQVNLNIVDSADGKTVLDYIQEKITENKGSALEPIYKNYYDTLRKYGAKHKSELI